MSEVRLIDGNALHDKVSSMGLQNGAVLGHHSGVADIIAEMIQNAPTIDQDDMRGHSKWVKSKEKVVIVTDGPDDCHKEPAIVCNHCDATMSQTEFDGWVWNFCPVCGFKMEDATND